MSERGDGGKQSPDERPEGEAPAAGPYEVPVDPEFPHDDNAPADERVEIVDGPPDDSAA